MSKRRLGNIFRRKFAFDFKNVFMFRKAGEKEIEPASAKALAGKEWIKSQLKDFSKLGGELVVMKMGN